MATRELQVVITGDAGDVRRALGDMGDQLGNLDGQTQESARGWLSWADSLKVAIADRAVDAVTSLAEAAVSTGVEFEQQMSFVQAVSGATGSELDTLRDKALQLGADTAFGATEAASAMEELVKAGLSVDEVLGGAADATVALAAAGGIELAEAATIAANAMNSFGLAAGDLPRIADLIAGAANTSAIDVDELGQSMQQVSAVAATVGLSFEDTATAIGLMGDAGIRGSDAGTSLKTMLQRLTPQTAQQARAMEELGLLTEAGTSAFFDQSGELKDLDDIAGILQSSLGGLSREQQLVALQTIFGSDAIRAAAVLMGEGAEGARDFAAGMQAISAEEVAETRMDNLAGAVEEFQGAVESFLIGAGAGVLVWFRDLVDVGTGAVEWLSDPPDGLTDWLADAGETVRDGVIPAWEDLLGAGENLWDLAVHLAQDLQPIGEGLLTIGGAAVIGGLQATATALEATTGFVAEHTEIVIAATAAYAAWNSAAKVQTGWTALSGGITAVTTSWGNFVRGAQFVALTRGVSTTRVAFDAARGSISNFLGTSAGMQTKAAGWAAGVAVIGWAIWEIATAADSSERAARSMFDALEAEGDPTSIRGLRDLIVEVSSEVDGARQTVDDYADGWGRLRHIGDMFTPLRNGLLDSEAAVEEGEERLASYERQLSRLERAAEAGGLSMQELSAAIAEADIDPGDATFQEWAEFVAGLREAGDVARNNTPGANDYAVAIQVMGDEAASSEEKVKALDAALAAIFNPQLDVWNATTKYRQALQSVTDALAENGATWDANTEAGQANRDAIAGAITAAMDLASAVGEQTGNADYGRQAMSLYTAEIRELWAASGLSEEQVRALAGELGLLPEDIEVLLGVTDDVTPSLEDAAAAYDSLRDSFGEPLELDKTRLELGRTLDEMGATGRETEALAAQLRNLSSEPAEITLDGERFYPVAAEVSAWADDYHDSSWQARALLNTGGAQLGFTSLSQWSAWYEALDPETRAHLIDDPAKVDFQALFSLAEAWRQANPSTSAYLDTSQARAALDSLAWQLASMGLSPQAIAREQATAGRYMAAGQAWWDAEHRAGGGPVRRGQPYVVGEHRPELFVPGVDGVILPSVPEPVDLMGSTWGGVDMDGLAARLADVLDRRPVVLEVDGRAVAAVTHRPLARSAARDTQGRGGR